MSDLKCAKCNTSFTENVKFCPNCGEKTEKKNIEEEKPINSESQKTITSKPDDFSMKLLKYFGIGIITIIALFIFLKSNGATVESILTEDVFIKSQKQTITVNSQMAYSLDIKKSGILIVDMFEIFGKNIEFNLLNEGQKVYESGVHKGKISTTIQVVPGKHSLIIINGNLSDSKTVELNVKIKY